MFWTPYLNDTDVNVLYELDWAWLPLYAGVYPEGKRAATDEKVRAIKKYFYDGGFPIGREWVGTGKKSATYVRDDRASYFA
jgi:hypothetical protein